MNGLGMAQYLASAILCSSIAINWEDSVEIAELIAFVCFLAADRI